MNRVALRSSRISVMQLPSASAAGDAEDVVMIHGLAASLGFWYVGAAQWFTKFGRVTMYDMLGHGHSDMPDSGYSPGQLAEDLEQLLDHLGIDRAHLVAHSFGGMVALSFALRHPHRVKSLVLADVRVWQAEPPSLQNVPEAWLQQMRDAGLRLDDMRMDPSFQVLVELAQLQISSPETAENVMARMPGGRRLFQGGRGARRWLELIEKTSAYSEMTSGAGFTLDDLPKIRQPMLAMFGEHSLRRRSARTLRRRCPNCRLEIIPNAGHFFPLTRPRIFAALTLEFLDAVCRPATEDVRRPTHRRGPRRRSEAGGYRSVAAQEAS